MFFHIGRGFESRRRFEPTTPTIKLKNIKTQSFFAFFLSFSKLIRENLKKKTITLSSYTHTKMSVMFSHVQMGLFCMFTRS